MHDTSDYAVQGVWTMQAQGKQPKIDVDAIDAVPTYSHMALVSPLVYHCLSHDAIWQKTSLRKIH